MINIPIFYCDKVQKENIFEFTNFGDILNKFIFYHFGINIIADTSNPKLYAIGSVLNNIKDDYNGFIWSSGMLGPRSKIKCIRKPLAVRGKLTKSFFDNIDNDVVLGDGALIIDRLYKPKIPIKYKLGIMPHYVDLIFNERDNTPFYNYEILKRQDVILIDIRNDIKSIIHTMLSCENIIVSCLHGAVVCDSYNIKHGFFYTKHSNYILFNNLQHSFKFNDYYSAFNMKFNKPELFLKNDTTIEECLKHCIYNNKPNIEHIKDNLIKTLKILKNNLI